MGSTEVKMRQAGKIIPIRDQIADQLRSDIISGDLEPNTKLNEKALADRFGVSRGPIRDVIIELTKEGLLITKQNCGASVNGALDPDIQELMFSMRLKIEEFAANKLKGKLSESDFLALEAILEHLLEAFNKEDYTEVTKTDIDFHRYLVDKAGGETLTNLWSSLIMRMRISYTRINQSVDCYSEHKLILDALRGGDTQRAVEALRANIKS